MVVSQRDVMGGLSKGLRVIAAFGAERPRQSIAEIAASTGLDRATARRCLLTLAADGYATHDGKFFTLTPRVLRLGMGCLASLPLPQIVQPWLDQLSDRTGHSASVSILDETEIVYLARAAQRRVMSIGLMPGSRLPAHCTSMGRVLLAALPVDEARAVIDASDLAPRTSFSLTDPDAILARIAEVRAQGVCAIDQEVELGLRSVAVPLLNGRGQAVAAMNLGMAAVARDHAQTVEDCLPLMLQTQAGLRRVLN